MLWQKLQVWKKHWNDKISWMNNWGSRGNRRLEWPLCRNESSFKLDITTSNRDSTWKLDPFPLQLDNEAHTHISLFAHGFKSVYFGFFALTFWVKIRPFEGKLIWRKNDKKEFSFQTKYLPLNAVTFSGLTPWVPEASKTHPCLTKNNSHKSPLLWNI